MADDLRPNESWFEQSQLAVERENGSLCFAPMPTLEGISALFGHLRHQASERLGAKTTGEVIDALVAVGQAWADRHYPLRQLAEKSIEKNTGFPAQTVRACLDAVPRQLQRGELLATLEAAVQKPEFLDGFHRRGDVLSRATGPLVTAQFVGGWSPGLVCVNLTLALLAKSAVLFRLSSDEPSFALLFSASLCEIDPVLGASVVPVWWPRQRWDLTAELVGRSDAIVAYGDTATLDAIRAAASETSRVVLHGPRIGIAYVDGESLNDPDFEDVAASIADAVSFGDQLSCLAPHLVLVDASTGLTLRLARRVAERLEGLRRSLPRRQPSVQDAVALRGVVSRYRLREGSGARGTTVLRSTGSLDWSVVVEPNPSVSGGPGYRCVRLCPVDGVAHAMDVIQRSTPAVSTLGLGASGSRWSLLAEALAKGPVSRVCRIETMHEPRLSWLHDGTSTLGRLVHWTDLDR